MPKFEVLSNEVTKRIENAKLTGNYESFAFDDKNVVRIYRSDAVQSLEILI